MMTAASAASNASCPADEFVAHSCATIREEAMRALHAARVIPAADRHYASIPSRRFPTFGADFIRTEGNVACLMRVLRGRPFVLSLSEKGAGVQPWPLTSEVADALRNDNDNAAASAMLHALGLEAESDLVELYAITGRQHASANAVAALRRWLSGEDTWEDGAPITHQAETSKLRAGRALERLLSGEEVNYGTLPVSPAAWSYLVRRGAVPWSLALDWDGYKWADECLRGETKRRRMSARVRRRAVLVGPASSGLGNHTDSLPTSNWYAQLSGSKRWHLCGAVPAVASVMDEDASSRSSASPWECFEGVLREGDILWHGSGWWHETECLDPRTVTLTTSGADPTARNGVLALEEKLIEGCISARPRDGDAADTDEDNVHDLCVALRRCHAHNNDERARKRKALIEDV